MQSPPLIPTAVALFLVLANAVALALFWDSDSQRAKRQAKKEQQAADEFRVMLHERVDGLLDEELRELLDDSDVWVDELEDRRAAWHAWVDDMSIDVVRGSVR